MKLPETPIQPSQQKTPSWQKTRKALRSLAAGRAGKALRRPGVLFAAGGGPSDLRPDAGVRPRGCAGGLGQQGRGRAEGAAEADPVRVYDRQRPTAYSARPTYDAVVWFQRKNGLNVDGVVGASTAAALGISLTGRRFPPSAYQESDSYLLARLVHGEARGEPYVGKVAVAAVVLNRVKEPILSQYHQPGWCIRPGPSTRCTDGQINLTPDSDSIRAAKRCAQRLGPHRRVPVLLQPRPPPPTGGSGRARCSCASASTISPFEPRKANA